MRFVIQRVTESTVKVDGKIIGQIGKGFMVLIGVADTDTKEIADKMIKNLQDQKNKIDSEFTEYVRSNGLINVKTNTDIDKLRKNAAGHKKALAYIANNSYFITMIQKYTQELDQYKRIVIKAANYNPRNLKESYAIQDYIDSACAFNEYVEFIDEM